MSIKLVCGMIETSFMSALLPLIDFKKSRTLSTLDSNRLKVSKTGLAKKMYSKNKNLYLSAPLSKNAWYLEEALTINFQIKIRDCIWH